MNNGDKKAVITRTVDMVKLSIIDLFDDGRVSSYGDVHVFNNVSEVTDEALLAWAKKRVAPEESHEVEIVPVEYFSGDEAFEGIKSSIDAANVVNSDINDDPSTAVNEGDTPEAQA